MTSALIHAISGGGAGVSPSRVVFERVTTLDLSGDLAINAGFFTLNISSDLTKIYGAAGVSGAVVIDISDISTPALMDIDGTLPGGFSWADCRNVIELDSTHLLSCHRSNSPNGGFVRTWEMANDGTLSILDTFLSTGGVPTTNAKYSDVSYDGSQFAYVSGQDSSAESFDLSDLNNISRVDTDIDASWETQGNAIAGNNVFFMNYGSGTYNIKAAPTTDGTFGTIVNTGVYTALITGTNQRAMRGVIDGDWLYCSVIETTNRSESGLLIYSISTPTQALPTPIHVPLHRRLGSANGSGDDPNFSIVKFEDHIYMSNGDRGIAVIDVSLPTSPIIKDTHGDGLPTNENIKALTVFRKDGDVYCVYASGTSANDPDYRTIYIDKVTFL